MQSESIINIPLEGNEGAAMRLGVILTRVERKETIENYPVSKFEIDRIPAVMKERIGYTYTIRKADDYWSFFSAHYIQNYSLN